MAADFPTKEFSRASRPGMFASLSNRDYRHYYSGQGVSLIGTWLQAAAVRWLVYEQTDSATLLGVIEVANLMPGLLFGLFAGAVSDRVRPRSMILAMEFGQMGCAFVLAVLVAAGVAQFWQMAVILALARVFVSFAQPSRQVYLYELVGPENLSNAIALNSGLFNATRVLGPALAGLGLKLTGAAWCFALNGISHFAAIGAVFAIRVDDRAKPAISGGAAMRPVLAGLYYLRDEPRIARLLALMGFFGLMGMGYESMMPVYATRVLGAQVGGYGLILACGGAGATVGALTVARLGNNHRKDRTAVLGLLTFATFLLAAAVHPGWIPPHWPPVARLILGGACLLGAGFGAAVFYSSTQTLIQLLIPPHLRGRIMGVWMVVFSGSVPLGALWTGRAASVWGVTPVMTFSAVVCVATGLFLLATDALAERPKALDELSADLADQ